MKMLRDLRDLEIGKAYNIEVNPGRYQYYGVIGKVSPNMNHPKWGSIYDNQGKLLASASYGQWIDYEEYRRSK